MNFKAHNKLTVGLTGGILCGKSTALNSWRRLGAYVLSCDDLVREISARPAVRQQINKALGTVDVAALAAKVFKCTGARKKLESILHPLVEKEIAKKLRASSPFIRVVEVPLLFEAGWEDHFDLTVALVCPEKSLSARSKRRNLSAKDLSNRSKAQWPQARKAARADICLVNAATVAELNRKIAALNRALCKIYNVK